MDWLPLLIATYLSSNQWAKMPSNDFYGVTLGVSLLQCDILTSTLHQAA